MLITVKLQTEKKITGREGEGDEWGGGRREMVTGHRICCAGGGVVSIAVVPIVVVPIVVVPFAVVPIAVVLIAVPPYVMVTFLMVPFVVFFL